MRKNSIRFIILLVLVVMVIAACDDNTPTPSGSTPDKVTKDQPPPQASDADLIITDVSVGPANDPTNTFTHRLTLTVRNNGGSDASGFNVSCRWSCAGGAVTSIEQDFIYDAYVQKNDQFTYREPFRDPCEVSFGSVSMTCVADSSNSIVESNENNNRWDGTANFN